jgi:hypothetical protein
LRADVMVELKAGARVDQMVGLKAVVMVVR